METGAPGYGDGDAPSSSPRATHLAVAVPLSGRGPCRVGSRWVWVGAQVSPGALEKMIDPSDPRSSSYKYPPLPKPPSSCESPLSRCPCTRADSLKRDFTPFVPKLHEVESRRMSSLSRRACYKCGNVGHYAEVCSSSERLCYNCKQPGMCGRNSSPAQSDCPRP
ncbi:uncharacterized protein IWZ02DRAFT_265709 [Phyllosticta citriasiana]|uniref:CCHC-type domain-containing protein n=1 Tax=Phyllosticta citriasiana TaxID=595635 RepID=A0ABR1KTX9_9PEZI